MTATVLTSQLADVAARALDAQLRVQLRLPAALLRSWDAPWPRQLPAAGEQGLQSAVAAGGALLLAYAAWAHANHRATATQVRALAHAGVGFLLSAFASASLRGHGPVGPAVSLVGAAFVLRGSLALVRERLESRTPPNERANGHAPGGPPPRA